MMKNYLLPKSWPFILQNLLINNKQFKLIMENQGKLTHFYANRELNGLFSVKVEAVETKTPQFIGFDHSYNQLLNKQYESKRRENVPQNFADQKNLSKGWQAWQTSEIRNIFVFYDQHGPQWKKMSEEIPQRKANDLKNRFYTVLRNLMKILFRRLLGSALTKEIKSKELCRLYDGRQGYEVCSGFIRHLLKSVQYDIESQKIDTIANQREDIISNIHELMYKGHEEKNILKPQQDKFEQINNIVCEVREAEPVPVNQCGQENQYICNQQQLMTSLFTYPPYFTGLNYYFWFQTSF